MSQFMKSMCKIAIPVTLQSMLQASFSIVDQLMIGQLGETNIAAVGICGNYSMLVSVLFSAVGAVAGILIAQFLGAEDRREAWSSFTVSMVLCGMIAILFCVASFLAPAGIPVTVGYRRSVCVAHFGGDPAACDLTYYFPEKEVDDQSGVAVK